MPPQPEPIAVVGFSCRLPGGNHSPQELWDFLERGSIASNEVPETRFNIAGHFDGSHKPGTMRPKGGMFLGDVDLADFDASFFEISGTEAIAMDPNQRQMLEVVYEGLENAGIPLEKLDGAPVACYVGSYASDYGDMQNRDAEDRPANCPIGVGRAIMANRLSYFLNIKGPSITIDTACSGSLVGLDLACRELRSGEVEAAIVATSNLYLNPDHVMDAGNVGQAHSPSALCHTFDADADGYVKAEAVSCVIVKRLSDAIRDRDPIRAIVRGSASNSNGRTGGIASPSSAAQAAAIRAAYANAGIDDFNQTAYLECHGTGTQAGDPTEINGAGSVFAASRDASRPLVIGSIKSNVGHSEPAAGNSGLMKAIMSIEKGIIPGNPTFIKPSPKINFIDNKMLASRTAIQFPDEGYQVRRVSINSFGYGGSNAHAIIEQPSALARSNYVSSYKGGAEGGEDGDVDYDEDDDQTGEEDAQKRLYSVVLSANDGASLKASIRALCNHLMNPRVKVDLADLAYTLSERRTRLWHRACVTVSSAEENYREEINSCLPTSVFTGQGAQWPQMGKSLLDAFPEIIGPILEELDHVLQTQTNPPPSWSIVRELVEPRSAEHLRQPELSQPLVTALQLCLVTMFELWGIRPSCVVGHSSGEIAAAYAAGYIDRAAAIKAAFYRGRAAVNRRDHQTERDVGMLAVGFGDDDIASSFLSKHPPGSAWVACYNSPSSLTISGRKSVLEALAQDIKDAGYFARLLQVDLAYHSELMNDIGEEYGRLLETDGDFKPRTGDVLSSNTTMFSSVTGSKHEGSSPDALYWKTNMVSPVRFADALSSLVKADSPNVLVEIGPSGALAGPVSQVLKSLGGSGQDTSYCAAWSRGSGSAKSLYNAAGRLFANGAPVDLALVNNGYEKQRTIVDLPNYSWNHTVKYWHENAASSEWRFKQFITHDLLGSKIPGTTWQAPTWKKHLNLADVPWLRDHKMGPDILVPGAGLATLALEAMYQKHCVLNPDEAITSPNELAYRFRNVKFHRAVTVEEGKPTILLVTLSAVPGSQDWHEFRVRTRAAAGVIYEHCHGLIRVQEPLGEDEALGDEGLAPLRHPQPADLWYKAQREVGMGFGPSFQKIKKIESVSGSRTCRTIVSLEPPPSKWDPQSYYPLHPAVLDGLLQTATPANAAGERSLVKDVMIPALVDDMVVNRMPRAAMPREGLSVAESVYTGRGRRDVARSWAANVAIHDPETGALILRVKGLNYIRLDVEEKPDPHVFHTVRWMPDISLLTSDQLAYLTSISSPPSSPLSLPENGASSSTTTEALNKVIDLIAFKKPMLKILETNLDDADTSTIWFDGSSSNADSESLRASYSKYDFASVDAKSLANVQLANESRSHTGFHVLAPDTETLGLISAVEPTYDLAIVKDVAVGRRNGNRSALERLVLRKLKPLLQPDASVLVVHLDEGGLDSKLAQVIQDADVSLQSSISGDLNGDHSSSSESREDSSSPTRETSSSASPTSSPSDPEDGVDAVGKVERPRVLDEDHYLLSSPREIATGLGSRVSYLYINTVDSIRHQLPPNEPWKLTVARFNGLAPPISHSLQLALEAAGWRVSTAPIEELASSTSVSTHSNITKSSSAVLVLDELFGPVLSTISEEKWEALRQVVSSSLPVLWVTKGGQEAGARVVTNPTNAMIQGLFRVIRREDPLARLTTLDVQSSTSPATGWAVDQVLRRMRGEDGAEAAETEYAECDGILHLQRLMPNVELNEFKAAENGKGLKLVTKGLHATEPQVRLQADKIGTLQSLTWCETDVGEVSVEPGMVEIEVMAVGVNFKDVATTMGIVPENEHMIGCECAGYVKRVASGVSKFQPGDRVAAMRSGTYVNRVQCPTDRAHKIPDWLSYEDAATIPLVYLTAIYSLYHLGNLKEGQSVLIHSAAGGVGIAAIQLAKYKKADIFVTVGTNDKREFLESKFGIPHNRIFSSRGTKFADEIRRETNGRGVDVILNSLIGELLDESWRLTADGGIMVEIGKRDIVDRNTLSMEPFDRNCSFRAVDLSYTREISNELIGRLMEEIFELVGGGHVGPIHPLTVYGFDEVIPALSYIRRGQHIGKIVISCGEKEDMQLPIRPAVGKLRLRPEASYLIVGGLKGLCGSLAVYMARSGARHIIVMSRTGTQDEGSARIISNCAAYGCEVTDAKGDVSDLEFVRGTFRSARHSTIAGVIQGAMVLRDKPYETMTHQDYHDATNAKVAGTWNLHAAALQEQRQPLDFFTMLSSISGVVGNKGQANYAAANAFLDAFASYRRGLALPANTVDLGAIEDVGYIAEQGGAALEARFDKKVWTPINESMVRQILGHSIFQQDSPASTYGGGGRTRGGASQIVTGLAYPLSTEASPDLAAEPRFAYLFGARHGPGSSGSDVDAGKDSEADQAINEFRAMHASAKAETTSLVRAATGLLLTQVTHVLRLETEMEPGKPLMAYGLDSLSAVELRGWIRQKLGAEVSTLDITNASSLTALSEKLVSKMFSG